MSIQEAFHMHYPDQPTASTAFCPYRVCPIGAHVDHQFGLISGFAINKGITIAYTPSESGTIEVCSANFPGIKQFLVASVPPKQNDWADYLRGAAKSLYDRYPVKTGLYAFIEGSLPIGGLSSSAAVILCFLSALCKVNDLLLSKQEIIEIALQAERGYVGVNVGTLDQSCELYSKKNHLLFLDTKDNSYECIPQSPDMPPFEIAVFFSGVERTLVGSAFNMRVDELKAASYALKAFSDMPYERFEDSHLRDVPKVIFEQYKSRLPLNWRKRAEHFYSEFERVQQGVDAWRRGDIETFGKLSFQSGYSSIYNYETGSAELKALYEIMLETKGIYGGRFSGAGFKGCCMALINPAYREQIKKEVTEKYLKRFPALSDKFSVHFCQTSDGCTF